VARIILAAGRRFGRFAVFLLVPPAGIIIALWLSLLDDHPGWFLSLAFIILPFVTITASFLVGTLVAGIQRSKISGLKRSEAPGPLLGLGGRRRAKYCEKDYYCFG
jgi:hypothetical protein